ncbi:MAG: bacillithiol biosynthesis cysteine-adding enzyme BshC [Candidatus Sulfotelmatobacter sp.]
MKSQCLPFAQIPHTTRVFTDFLSYSPAVRQFYPHSPHFNEWFKAQASNIKYEPARRERVSAILERQNKSWDASPKTLSNIKRFRAGAAAIVTGQQVGLFGGPMFSIYKALSAVKLADEATAAGVDSVPIFWLATYDHDLEEVNHVSVPGPDGLLRKLTASSHSIPGAPVSEVRLGNEIVPVVEEAVSLLGDSEAAQILRGSYRPGETLGSAFARFYARLFAAWGVIILDASDPELHRIAAPIYRNAIEHVSEINNALLARGQALEAAGYHQQVKVTTSSVPVFTLQNGARTPIQRRTNGDLSEFVIGSAAESEKLSADDLLDRIATTPENFSPNVLLRPVVQDYLLPTLAYAGGAAEAAYFAQAGAVYEKLLGRVTPIVPRFSATLVEPKVQRALEKYGIAVRDTFQGLEGLRHTLAARAMPADLQAAFERANQSVEESFSSLHEALAKLDPTLVEASQTAVSKAHYQLDRLRERAMAAELRRSEVIARKAELLNQALYPEDGLQERGVAGIYFLARYGTELLKSLYEAMRTDCLDHQILEL